ncbi:MAG: hypothetical protein ACM3JI_02365, partial [Anaerolineae bacterium]
AQTNVPDFEEIFSIDIDGFSKKSFLKKTYFFSSAHKKVKEPSGELHLVNVKISYEPKNSSKDPKFSFEQKFLIQFESTI